MDAANAGPQGRPAEPAGVWHRRVWHLAAPLMLGNISAPLLGAVDTAVIGHLDDAAYLGGLAIGAMAFNFLYWSVNFLRMGTSAMTAQARGADDRIEGIAVLVRAIGLGLAIGLAMVALQWPFRVVGLAFFDASTAVQSSAAIYMEVRIWSAPATLINFVLLGWFLGSRQPVTALLLQVLLNGTNIVLDLVFVVGLDAGVAGVAVASVCAEYLTAATGLLLAASRIRRPALKAAWPRIRYLPATRRLLSINGNLFIRTLCLVTAFALFTRTGAGLGDTVLAANLVLLQFQMFCAFALDGFADSAEVLVGTAVGSRSRRDLRAAVATSTLWAGLFASAFAVAFAVFGGALIDLLTGIEGVRAAAREFLPWLIASPLISVWSFQLDGIFVGATRGSTLRNAMLVSLAVFVAAIALLVPALGNHGLWLAFSLFMVARTATLAVAYPSLLRSVVPR